MWIVLSNVFLPRRQHPVPLLELTMSNAILAFLEDRKQTKLKKPGDKTAEQIDREYAIVDWVANAASRAGQLSMVSHPGKFSHPDAKISPLLYQGTSSTDGFVRSGNVTVPTDVLGNAAALDVYGFLSIQLTDGNTIFQHIESGSQMLRELLGVEQAVFDEWRVGFLKIKSDDDAIKTDGNIKQVYFPVSNGYHLLSVLTPSGLVTQNRERIRQMKFAEEAKVAREARKNNETSESGLNDINDLLKLKFGGTQPQNISKLNSGNAGEAWLMPSLPPAFSPKYVRIPRRNFFESLFLDEPIKLTFATLHRMFTTDYNNVNIRDGRRKCLESIFDWVFDRATFYQQHTAGWTDDESVRLPVAQKIWLDQARFNERDEHLDWQDEIAEAFSAWTIVTYRRLRKRSGDAVALGQTEETAFTSELKDYARRMREDLV